MAYTFNIYKSAAGFPIETGRRMNKCDESKILIQEFLEFSFIHVAH